jgi:hypothetical protein
LTLTFSLPKLPRLRARQVNPRSKLAEPRSDNQRHDHRTWSPSTMVGETMVDPLNPVLFEI